MTHVCASRRCFREDVRQRHERRSVRCRRLDFSTFNADSIDVDASIDRGAKKRSKITSVPVQPELQYRNFLATLERASALLCFGYVTLRTCNHSRAGNAVLIPLSAASLSSPYASFSYPSSSLPPFATFRSDKIICAPITRENLVIICYLYVTYGSSLFTASGRRSACADEVVLCTE